MPCPYHANTGPWYAPFRYAFSFESVNYPGWYVAPMAGDTTRPGIVHSPSPLDASWAVAPTGGGGGFTLTSLSPNVTKGSGLAAASDLTGTCAESYSPPSKSAAISGKPHIIASLCEKWCQKSRFDMCFAPKYRRCWVQHAPRIQNKTIQPPISFMLDFSGNGGSWNINLDHPGGGGGTGYPPRADCVVWQIYDQSGNGNHMLPATPAINNPAHDNPVNATKHPITMGGHKVYGAYFETGMGYRAQNTSKVATGNDPETIYMVTSGIHVNGGCCFDYGNRWVG